MPESGASRFLADLRAGKVANMKDIYDPYLFQRKFHRSTAPYGFLGGAAGPGKTMAMLMEQFQRCGEFNVDDGPKVHTIMFRRTFPTLEATVITRFRETFPKELYRQYNATKNVVTWMNGSQTHFGSMQYEHDVWAWQGQWFHIAYDEMCEFTFTQFQATSAWNRCPVSTQTRKYGAGNPIGIGAIWVEDLFVKKVPCLGMDEDQKRAYDPKDYDYFPATYLDNPIYANDPKYIKNLDAYPAAIREALKLGKWGAAGGYFRGVWDESIHLFNGLKFPFWWKRYLSGNWGYEHPATYYKHVLGDDGEVYTYDELWTQHENPETLAEHIAEWAREPDEHGKMAVPRFQSFTHSFDADATKRTATMGDDTRSVNQRMVPVLRRHGIPDPVPSTRDKLGRDTLMRELLAKRIRTSEDSSGHPIEIPGWRIAEKCTQLRRIIPIIKADPIAVEQIENSGDGTDSPLQGSGYGLYAIFGRTPDKPFRVDAAETRQVMEEKGLSMTEVAIKMQKMQHEMRTRQRGRRSRWAR